MKFGCLISIFLNSAHLICRSTDISKCFRVPSTSVTKIDCSLHSNNNTETCVPCFLGAFQNLFCSHGFLRNSHYIDINTPGNFWLSDFEEHISGSIISIGNPLLTRSLPSTVYVRAQVLLHMWHKVIHLKIYALICLYLISNFLRKSIS